MDTFIAERLATLLAKYGELEPPWARYPGLPRSSPGWKMGVGQDYLLLWNAFRRERFTEAAALFAYLRRHPPAPRGWRAGLVQCFADLPDARIGPALDRFVCADHLVGDDVAFPIYVRNAYVRAGCDRLPAPWTELARDVDPARALRSTPRQLGWWARWFAEQRVEAGAYLATQPPAPPAWREVAERLGERDVAPWHGPDRGAVELIVAMACHGWMPPPWSGDRLPPPQLVPASVRDDRHLWAGWAFETFDDTATWQAYWERWPPPRVWQTFLDTKMLNDLRWQERRR